MMTAGHTMGFQRLLHDTAAQAMADYALVLGLIVLAAVVAVTALGGGVSGAFSAPGAQLGSAMTRMAEGS
jgi:Flp pilus assembly pilin Flp